MSAQEQLRERTKQFAFRIIRLFKSLPHSTERARSRAEFIAKIGVFLEQADEAVFRLEALIEAGVVKPAMLAPLLKGANELVAILAASQRTARSNCP